MTATEELRRLLVERGVEWGANDTYRLFVTSWSDASGHSWAFMEHRDGSFSKLTAYHLTTAQAIAATLGDVPRLPYFWTADGTLHVELPRLPESISVRLPDQRDREVGSARTWRYTRDNETCHVECFDDGIDEGLDGEPIFTSPTWYLSCGHTTQDSERPNFCPVCGKVVD